MSTVLRRRCTALAFLIAVAILVTGCRGDVAPVARDGSLAVEALVGSAGGGTDSGTRSPAAAGADRPNIVFVLMDDFSMDLLPTMRSARYMARHGASYDNAFVVDSLCCVSRSATFTGQYPHQTRVLTNGANRSSTHAPTGGWSAFHRHGGEKRTFAVQLQRAGYTTGYVGKYLNQYEPDGAALPPIPPGWSDFRAVFPDAYDQWEFSGTKKKADGTYGLKRWPAPPASASDREKDAARADVVIGEAGLRFIRQHADEAAPFFVQISTFGPHTRVPEDGPAYDDEPVFPPAFRDLPGHRKSHGNCGLVDCRDLTGDDLPGFGEIPANRPFNQRGGGSGEKLDWEGTPLDREQLETDLRNRAQMAQSIDRFLMRILRTVDDNTYVVLSSDNGFHLGQLGMKRGKGSAYDTDAHVPLLVVGPGVVPGHRSTVTSNLDLASTFEDLAGVDSPAYRSGTSLVPSLRNADKRLHDVVFFEHTYSEAAPGEDPDRPFTGGGLSAIPSYVAVRSRGAVLIRSDLDRRWGHHQYVYEFYDYSGEGWEKRNQYDNPAFAPQVATLRAELDRFDACRRVLRKNDPVSGECRKLN